MKKFCNRIVLLLFNTNNKTLIIMKFAILLTLFCTLPVSASLYSQDTKLNLSAKDKTLREVIKMIENHSDFRFFFSDDYVDLNKKIDLTVKNKNIKDVLTDLLVDGTVTYKVLDNNVIVITPNAKKQTNEISGTITDAQSGDPLPSVNILIKGTTKGTVSDLKGNYTIAANPGETLVFSYIGYLSEEVVVSSQTEVNIKLAPDLQQLDEIVVVGYGAVKKRDLTGSVSSMNNEMVTSKGTASPMSAVQGQAAGVDISASTGRAGENYKIQIRGVNTLSTGTARDPLYVVDGIFTDNINFLNPQEIERIDILKDASSTAIYGSRGSNGVVIVTTRRGSDIKSKAEISYDGYYGVRQVARMPDFMSGDRWWEYRQDAYVTGYELSGATNYRDDVLSTTQYSTSSVLRDRIDNKDYTDWPSLFQRTGNQQNHFLTISGQRNDVSYIIGIGYQDEKGNITREWNKKYNLKASIVNKISDKWNSGININLSYGELEMGNPTAIQTAYRMAPLLAPYDSTGALVFQPGKYAGISFTSSVNPLWNQNDAYDNTNTFQGLSNIYLEFKPVQWISLKSTLSTGIKNIRNGQYFGSHTSQRTLKDPSASLNKSTYFDYTWDNQLNVTKEFNGHSFNFMGMQSVYYTRYENSFINVQNLPYDSKFDNLGSATTIDGVGSLYQKTTLVSLITRLNYAYKDKYLVTISDRWDGSSKLAAGHQWTSFPSFALAWRVSAEDFMQSLDFLSSLKARVSYGFVGNDNIPPYLTQSNAGLVRKYDFLGVYSPGNESTGLANKVLTWERSHELDAGLDFGFIQGRIYGTVDFYNKLSEKLLMQRKLPFESGWNLIWDNVGSVRNKGVELSLTTVNIDSKNFNWTTSFNFSKNKNEIVELYGEKVDDIGNNWFIGNPVNVIYNYNMIGIWQESERAQALTYGQLPGQAKVLDADNSGAIEAGKDKMILGSPDPDWIGGFSTTVQFKNFDLSGSLYTKQGVFLLSYFHQNFANVDDRGRQKLDINFYMPANEMTPAHASNEYPQPKNVGPYYQDVGYYRDASFVKVKNISLGYTFDNTLVKKMSLNSLRLYVNVLNPFVFTKYDGFDPEWADATYANGGVSSVTYQFGVNVKF